MARPSAFLAFALVFVAFGYAIAQGPSMAPNMAPTLAPAMAPAPVTAMAPTVVSKPEPIAAPVSPPMASPPTTMTPPPTMALAPQVSVGAPGPSPANTPMAGASEADKAGAIAYGTNWALLVVLGGAALIA